MNITPEEWQTFTPGVRMYKGKKTCFYNGQELMNGWDDHDNPICLVYSFIEKQTWEAVVVLPGVEVIQWGAFCFSKNLERVMMSDSVKRIEAQAFYHCYGLKYIQQSRNLTKDTLFIEHVPP
ncbi:predicted protein [Chaetoceros tenuissimus]|uniref:Leucine-rich repeat domain-containing protein n=1 Tax=Chaetoceros tenuissimus TaxID=426638 RepID=A0AAD3D3F4_9STRA|nr:predicted protein [Chaetoceros tenuissimus]